MASAMPWRQISRPEVIISSASVVPMVAAKAFGLTMSAAHSQADLTHAKTAAPSASDIRESQDYVRRMDDRVLRLRFGAGEGMELIEDEPNPT